MNSPCPQLKRPNKLLPRTRLLRKGLARSTHLLGQVLHFGEAVLDAKDGLCVVDVKLRLVAIAWDRSGVHVDQPPQRVIGQQVPAASLAELAVALFGLVVDANVAVALTDLHRIGFPEAECVDGRRRPTPARRAMTEARRH